MTRFSLPRKADGTSAVADIIATIVNATTVAAANAVMESDTTTAAMSFVVDEDTMTSNSATKVPTQQSVKAYVDAGGGTGRTVNTATHTVSGALSITRAAVDQYTVVTVNEDVTAFTDNMSNSDILRLVLINGTAADYTMDLSGLTYLDDQTALPDTVPMYQTTELVLLLEKVQGTVYAVSFSTLVAGSPQAGAAIGYRATSLARIGTASAAMSIPGTPTTGDRIIIGVVSQGTTAESAPTWTVPTNGNTVTELFESTIGTYNPIVKVWETTYDGSTPSFTFGASGGAGPALQTQFMVVCNGAGSLVRASVPVNSLDSGSLSSVPVGSLALAIGTIHDNVDTYNAAPSGYTYADDNFGSGYRAAGVAYFVTTTAGTIDPGAWDVDDGADPPQFPKSFVISVDS